MSLSHVCHFHSFCFIPTAVDYNAREYILLIHLLSSENLKSLRDHLSESQVQVFKIVYYFIRKR